MQEYDHSGMGGVPVDNRWAVGVAVWRCPCAPSLLHAEENHARARGPCLKKPPGFIDNAYAIDRANPKGVVKSKVWWSKIPNAQQL